MTPAARERWQVHAPVLLMTAAAWIALLAKPGCSGVSGSCCIPTTLREGISSDSINMLMNRNPPGSLALGWALMVGAMMTPLLSAPVRHVLDRSFARRRARAVLLFIAGYAAIWVAAGVAILAVVLPLRLFLPASFGPAAAASAVALVWQCSPWKQRYLNRGHAHVELVAFSAAADLAVLRFGATHGISCVGSCWAVMLASELFPVGHVAVMAVVTLWLLAERLDGPMLPAWRFPSGGKAARLALAQARILFH